MTALVYPPSLPCPTSAPITATERRALSTLDGQRQSRTLWRDRHATRQVQFVFTFAQSEVFQNWFDSDLLRGGAWFACDWRMPDGSTISVCRFIGAPSYPQFLGALGWRVTATVEVRGRSMLPRRYPTEIDPDILLYLRFQSNFVDESSYGRVAVPSATPPTATGAGLSITDGSQFLTYAVNLDRSEGVGFTFEGRSTAFALLPPYQALNIVAGSLFSLNPGVSWSAPGFMFQNQLNINYPVSGYGTSVPFALEVTSVNPDLGVSPHLRLYLGGGAPVGDFIFPDIEGSITNVLVGETSLTPGIVDVRYLIQDLIMWRGPRINGNFVPRAHPLPVPEEI